MHVLSNKKEFNRLLRKKYRQFRHKLLNKIVESNNSSPDDFWKSLNTFVCWKKEITRILTLTFYQMNGLNISRNFIIDYNNNFNDNNFSFDDSQNCNTELNCSITAEEVVLTMKSLKNKNRVVLMVSLMKCWKLYVT